MRRQFNQAHHPEHFLYLLARCVKAAIRYNSKGEFNNSPDNHRLGAEPGTMRWHLMHASKLLQHKASAACEDFRDAIASATPDDVIFMDPPYQGVGKERDSRYVQCLTFDAFSDAVRDMVARELCFIISYDGRTGDKRHGQLLPNDLGLLHFEVVAGKSTTETLLGRCAVTYESIYLSQPLANRLVRLPSFLVPDRTTVPEQLSLFSAAVAARRRNKTAPRKFGQILQN